MNEGQERQFERKRNTAAVAIAAMMLVLTAGCGNGTDEASARVTQPEAPEAVREEGAESPSGEEPKAEPMPTAAQQQAPSSPISQQEAMFPEAANADDPAGWSDMPETLGDPRSSFGLGSASFLKGRNVLCSLFVTTPESSFTKEEQEKALEKLKTAAAYIEEQAKGYDTDVELICDWTEQEDLKAEADTDFCINENVDYMDRLDEEIARWFEQKISFEDLIEEYDAEGIAVCVFVNNPGISYAIVYDGTDNVKESIILFTGDHYKKGQEETAATYAHEILHVFGAHDLYEDAEFTKEVTDYVEKTYPDEIMFTVSESSKGSITQTVSPITAYHLGWLADIWEVDVFPQLDRN